MTGGRWIEEVGSQSMPDYVVHDEEAAEREQETHPSAGEPSRVFVSGLDEADDS